MITNVKKKILTLLNNSIAGNNIIIPILLYYGING